MEVLATHALETCDIQVFHVAKVAVVNYAGHLLIMWRSSADSYRPLGADFPGGEIEPGETPVQAALRETEEETEIGLTLEQLRLVGSFAKDIQEPDNPIKTIMSTVYVAHVGDPTVRLNSSEHSGAVWLPPIVVRQSGLLAASASKMACLDVILDK